MAEKSNERKRSHFFTLNEVLSQLEDDDEAIASSDVYISPPDDGNNSDEDDINEDLQESVSASDLPGRQLRSRAYANVISSNGSKRTIGRDDSDDSSSESDEDDINNDGKASTSHRRTQAKRTRIWRKEDLSKLPDTWNEETPTFLSEDFTPTKCFERFFDDTVINHIVTETLRYAKSKGDHSFTIDGLEMRAFLAILLISGYNEQPRRRMYWEQQEDSLNAAISTTMSRNRFDTIMHYVHVADNNNLPTSDRFAKVRPLYDLLNERFVMFFPMQKNLSVDESMIPYYGKHSLKQCIRGKPIRFGYKQWVIATDLGYAVHLELYQGAGAGYDRHVGLGHTVVMGLVERLPKGPHYQLYFDNYFTGFNLLKGLKEIGIGATGTVRSNRTEKCPIDLKSIKKSARGTFDFRHDREDDIIVCAWNDNSVVTIASNKDSVFPLSKASRWSSQEKKKVEIDQPAMINKYNRHMGGVDRLDQNVGQYRITIRSKKWWWPLFAFLPDAAINNAWLLYRMSPAHGHLPLDQLGFKRSVAMVYVMLHRARQAIPRTLTHTTPSKRQKVAAEVRQSTNGHHLQTMPKQRRCRHCGKKANMLCKACNAPLHQKCSESYHS